MRNEADEPGCAVEGGTELITTAVTAFRLLKLPGAHSYTDWL